MGRKEQKHPVTEKMMKNALGDQGVSLFSVQVPLKYDDGSTTGYRFLFTNEVHWPGCSDRHPVHLGIYLEGCDSFLNRHLFRKWHIMISDLRGEDPYSMRDDHEVFKYDIARHVERKHTYVLFNVHWGSDHAESIFWDKAFHWPENQHSFMRMVSCHHPAPHDLAPTGSSYGGKGVGFKNMVPEMKRTWRVWHEWLVTASVMTLAD